MARKKKTTKPKDDEVDKRCEKLRKRSENLRKRLLLKSDLELSKLNKAKEITEKEEEEALEAQILEDYKASMAQCDREAKQFYPNPEEWEEKMKKLKRMVN